MQARTWGARPFLTVGGIAGRTRTTRLGYTAVAFGVWDICYYLFLKIMCDWPKSLFDWDILFLIPLPWWAPVIAPVSIALYGPPFALRPGRI